MTIGFDGHAAQPNRPSLRRRAAHDNAPAQHTQQSLNANFVLLLKKGSFRHGALRFAFPRKLAPPKAVTARGA
ncbi:MAG TPA: hypothetical protein VNW92_01905, partial [Polyangiaceae bacterium]|nr:hypothetical protein [Polyangiaceae bacterium]